MVTMGIFFPLQGWMMAIDGILIGARDYRYLAVTCTLTAVVYVTLILILANMVTPALTSDLMRTAVLWAAFNVVLMGGRGLSNGAARALGRWDEVGIGRAKRWAIPFTSRRGRRNTCRGRFVRATWTSRIAW